MRVLLANLRAYQQYRQGFYTQVAIGELGVSTPLAARWFLWRHWSDRVHRSRFGRVWAALARRRASAAAALGPEVAAELAVQVLPAGVRVRSADSSVSCSNSNRFEIPRTHCCCNSVHWICSKPTWPRG